MSDKNTIISVDTVVIGTGAAGFNAACRIKKDGVKNIAIVTEGVNCGTSRNTGSDKQTYYKLGLGGDNRDSVRQMASDLFACGSMDGDNALCEAALSARSFLNLCELGVQFPMNRYGEYIGYKTDHDPYARATSVGPLTSKFMTEALEKEASRLGVMIYDNLLVIKLLKNENGICGILAYDKENEEYVTFRCANAVYATGGPAGIYADSVYPECHTGSTGVALEAGVAAQNLTEWQYGLASINPRWNVSGTYMQVLPRFVSVDENGNEREFLLDYFDDVYEALSMVFLKGYQWPFDSRKVMSGSSVIDLLVYRECVIKKRRVYLDYRKNPFGLENIEFEKLSEEALTYLKNAGACFGNPLERLLHMNKPAVDLYSSKGLELSDEMLEIALCAQHCNGGLAVDLWWQTSLEGLFAVGEVAGTHGVTRPGGSALNSGQVGSLRASQYISANTRKMVSETEFSAIDEAETKAQLDFTAKITSNPDNIDEMIAAAQRRMSDFGAAIRNPENIKNALSEAQNDLNNFTEIVGASKKNLFKAYKLRDILIAQITVLSSMLDFSEKVSGTRGSALYTDEKGGLRDGLDEVFRFTPADPSYNSKVQQTVYSADRCANTWRDVRPIPASDDFFEVVWQKYRENKNIY